MDRIVYRIPNGTTENFQIEYDREGKILSLKNPSDPHGMNWTRGKEKWGTLLGNSDLSVEVVRTYTDRGTLLETYLFKNETDFDIYSLGTETGVYTPFPDYYTNAETCMNQCCHTHIWCGGNGSYIMALRMGGEAPHLGVALREGRLQGYSVERITTTDKREEELSNHRGDFILHPENFCLRPGEVYTLTWELFWFSDKEDFQRKLRNLPNFVQVASDRFVLLGKEMIRFQVWIGEQEQCPNGLIIRREGEDIPFAWEKGCAVIEESPRKTGEYVYEILWKNTCNKAVFLVLPELEILAEKRCLFIAQHHQCHDRESRLDGAFLIYDNEERQQYYSHRNDHNGGRERVGMGVLLAFWLREHPNQKLQEALDKYVEYVLRELFDVSTGTVYNDVGRNQDTYRLYNYPWMGRLFMELYHLTKENKYLVWYYRCMEAFYQAGGSHFYAIGIPMRESVQTMEEARMDDEAKRLVEWYRTHVDYIVKCGRNYPAHEVDYEQSIVAPAAIYLCELYHLTGEEKYRKEALEQMAVLDLFQGFQPDYHLNETAIRHWDGYWFGKRRCLGDTFPHYWSALSGYAGYAAAGITEAKQFTEKYRSNLRGVLSLFKEDGSASCAMVYPMSVNGKKAAFYDPWANDQDWGLYFVLKYGSV